MKQSAVFAVLGLAFAAPAAADTIYLVSGRLIRTASVRVEDGRVHFTQFGGEVSIPLHEVARIVDDDEVERRHGEGAGGAARGDDPAAAAGQSSPATTTANPSGETGTSADADDPEYWIERIRDVDRRIARVQSELDRLPYYDETDKRLLRFNGQARYFIAERRRWETLMADLELSRRRLLYGARKAGILPGSLRDGLRK